MPEGITNLEAAFAEAASESDLVQSDDVEVAEPAAEAEDVVESEQADPEAVDQPDVAETPAEEVDEQQALVDSLLEDEASEDPDQSDDAGALDLSTEIEIDFGDGAETVTIQDLVDGRLRQADYTRKTQALAAEKADFETAVEFHKQFESDPIAFAKLLAVRANLISEQDAGQLPDTEVATIQSQADIEAEVEKRVQERLASDPLMQEAAVAATWARVNATFDQIEADNGGITISPEVRQSIVDEGARRGVNDLELIFQARMAKAQAKRDRAAEKRKASSTPSKPSPASAPTDDDPDEVYDSVDKAFLSALAEVG